MPVSGKHVEPLTQRLSSYQYVVLFFHSSPELSLRYGKLESTIQPILLHATCTVCSADGIRTLANIILDSYVRHMAGAHERESGVQFVSVFFVLRLRCRMLIPRCIPSRICSMFPLLGHQPAHQWHEQMQLPRRFRIPMPPTELRDRYCSARFCPQSVHYTVRYCVRYIHRERFPG